MAAVASSRVMLRSCALALFAFAFLAWPAVAADTGVTFRYYAYSPSNARIAVHDTLTFTPDAGNDFENTPDAAHHPLHFDDNTIGGPDLGQRGGHAALRHVGRLHLVLREPRRDRG